MIRWVVLNENIKKLYIGEVSSNVQTVDGAQISNNYINGFSLLCEIIDDFEKCTSLNSYTNLDNDEFVSGSVLDIEKQSGLGTNIKISFKNDIDLSKILYDSGYGVLDKGWIDACQYIEFLKRLGKKFENNKNITKAKTLTPIIKARYFKLVISF